jgi:hypothetical protein
MTNKIDKQNEFNESALTKLGLRPKERLTCCNCKNQTFLLVYGCSDFPFFDCLCSKCGSGYPLQVGK